MGKGWGDGWMGLKKHRLTNLFHELKVSNSWLMVVAMAVNVSFFADKKLEETVASFLEASCLHSN